MIAPLLPVVICGVACSPVGGSFYQGQVAQLTIDVRRNDDESFSVSVVSSRFQPWTSGEVLALVRCSTLAACEHAIDRALADGAALRSSARVTLRERRAA